MEYCRYTAAISGSDTFDVGAVSLTSLVLLKNSVIAAALTPEHGAAEPHETCVERE